MQFKSGWEGVVVAVSMFVVGRDGVLLADGQADPAKTQGLLDAITTESAARILLAEAPTVLGWCQWRRMDSENSVVHLRDALEATGVAPHLLEAIQYRSLDRNDALGEYAVGY